MALFNLVELNLFNSNLEIANTILMNIWESEIVRLIPKIIDELKKIVTEDEIAIIKFAGFIKKHEVLIESTDCEFYKKISPFLEMNDLTDIF